MKEFIQNSGLRPLWTLGLGLIGILVYTQAGYAQNHKKNVKFDPATQIPQNERVRRHPKLRNRRRRVPQFRQQSLRYLGEVMNGGFPNVDINGSDHPEFVGFGETNGQDSGKDNARSETLLGKEDQLENELDRKRGKVEEHRTRITQLQKTIRKLRVKVNNLKKKAKNLGRKLNALKNAIKRLKKAMKDSEGIVGIPQNQEFVKEVLDGDTLSNKDLNKLEKLKSKLKTKKNNIDEDLKKNRKTLKKKESAKEDLEHSNDQLETEIDQLEVELEQTGKEIERRFRKADEKAGRLRRKRQRLKRKRRKHRKRARKLANQVQQLRNGLQKMDLEKPSVDSGQQAMTAARIGGAVVGVARTVTNLARGNYVEAGLTAGKAGLTAQILSKAQNIKKRLNKMDQQLQDLVGEKGMAAQQSNVDDAKRKRKVKQIRDAIDQIKEKVDEIKDHREKAEKTSEKIEEVNNEISKGADMSVDKNKNKKQAGQKR